MTRSCRADRRQGACAARRSRVSWRPPLTAARPPNSAYKNNLRRLGTFDTVEEFWRHYIYLKRPSELETDVNVYLFRKQLTPMWEVRGSASRPARARSISVLRVLTRRTSAQTFPNGGCWILKVRNKSGAVSQLWQDLVFAAIGEVFEEPGLVGVVLAMRSRDSYLAVWHADNASTRTRFLIGYAPRPRRAPAQP